jgi:hypothetical protein
MAHDTNHFDPRHRGATGAPAGQSFSVSRIIFPLLMWGVLAWGYVNADAVAQWMGIEGSATEAEQSVRSALVVVGIVILVIVALSAVARTRRVRRDGMPPVQRW